VVDLSSWEEDAFLGTSRGEKIARKLFGDLNYGLLGPPGDGNVIILNDSNEKDEEVCEDDHANIDAVPSSDRDSPAHTAFAAANDDTLDGVQNDSSGGSTPDRVQGGSSDSGDEACSPLATTPKGVSAGSGTEESKNNNDFYAVAPQIVL
jgi:hypothetical protein